MITQEDRVAGRLVAALAALALLPGMVGCSSGDGGTASDSAPPAAAVSADEALACMKQEGLEARMRPVGPGEQLGITDSIQVQIGTDNRIVVDFFTDSAKAADYAADQEAFLTGAGAGGGAEVVADTVVVGYARSGAEAELAKVTGCLTP